MAVFTVSVGEHNFYVIIIIISAWDVTAVCTVADSYVAATAREAGAAAERAAELKISKYSVLKDKCIFSQLQWSRMVHSMRQLVSF